MIKEFVKRFEDNKEKIENCFRLKHPDDYDEIVKIVIENITSDDNHYEGYAPDPERITTIDHGDYQGTLLYIIAEKGYQPYIYYSVFVGYGSCSGCDTLQSINEICSSESPNDEQVKDYMTLALHIVQKLKKMDDLD